MGEELSKLPDRTSVVSMAEADPEVQKTSTMEHPARTSVTSLPRVTENSDSERIDTLPPLLPGKFVEGQVVRTAHALYNGDKFLIDEGAHGRVLRAHGDQQLEVYFPEYKQIVCC